MPLHFPDFVSSELNITRLPKNLLDATRNTEPKVPEVYALIKAIEPAESAICNRIDAEGLVVLCWALLSSPYCFAQRRGFYLITVYYTKLAGDTWILTSDRNRCITTNRIHLRKQPRRDPRKS